MELDVLELEDLLESPNEAVEQGYEGLIEAMGEGEGQLLEQARSFGELLLEGGMELLSEVLGNLLEQLGESGVLEELAGVLGQIEGLLETLQQGLEAVLAEIPPEELAKLATILIVGMLEPELLLENPELLLRLLAAGPAGPGELS